MHEDLAVEGPVLYLVVCGSQAADGVAGFIPQARAAGWEVCVITTPMGSRFVDLVQLEQLSGYPVLTGYGMPGQPDVLPPPDAYLVAPATFNSVNKMAQGISDTLAVGLVCEGLGLGRPVIVVPWVNPALARHGAYRRSIAQLEDDGARILLTEGTRPGASHAVEAEPFPWSQILKILGAPMTNCQ